MNDYTFTDNLLFVLVWMLVIMAASWIGQSVFRTLGDTYWSYLVSFVVAGFSAVVIAGLSLAIVGDE